MPYTEIAATDKIGDSRTPINSMFEELFNRVAIDGSAANFSALPSAAANSGKYYLADASEGSWILFTLKKAGVYKSDGADWNYLGAAITDQRIDSNMVIGDDGDTTKTMGFELAGATASTKSTLEFNQTANRTITFFDSTDTIVGKNTTDNLTNKTINTASNTITVVEADISDLGAYIENIVEDTSPQLGGSLDVNSNEITGAIDLHSTGDIIQELGDAAGTNKVSIRDSGGIEVAAIDSDGNITTSGTVDGVDIAGNIDQDVTSGSTPTFTGTNFTGIPNGALTTNPLARANHTGTQAASTISDFDTEVSNNASVAANTAKTTNATHTGDVTGATALTIDSSAITGKGTVTAASGDFLLISDTSDSGNLKKVDASDFTGGSGDMVLADVQVVTGLKTFGTAGGAVGKFALAGSTSGTTVVDASATASGTITIPAATDTLVGKATTDSLTNKSIDADGTGNAITNIDVAEIKSTSGLLESIIFFKDGNGTDTITAGAADTVLTAVRAGTITGWYVNGDDTETGGITADILKNGTSIVGAGTKPFISASNLRNSSTTLTSWTTTFVAGDRFKVSYSGITTFTSINVTLTYDIT